MESRQSQSASRPAAADRRAGRPALLAGVHVLPTARLPHAGTSERGPLGAGVGVLDHPLSARTAQPIQRQVVRRHDARQSDDQSGSPDDVHLRPRHLGRGTEGSGRRPAGKNQAGKQRLHKRLEVKRRRGGKRFFHARAAAIVERILREKTLRRMQYRQEYAVLSI